MPNAHPDLISEQRYLDGAYALLEKKMDDQASSFARYEPVDRNSAQALRRALSIREAERVKKGALIFGRMDDDDGSVYVGRRAVFDENYDPVVISWHTPAAAKYYEASPSDPRGLHLKRAFVEEDRRLVRLIDEIVKATPQDVSQDNPDLPRISDALLEELERQTDGALRDVISTIQSEQYAIMRDAQGGVLVVQGGPGTGKTVVGLHRAAWLAFNSAELRSAGLLVIAPNVPFLTYMAGVLPGLNAGDVRQMDIGGIYAGDAQAKGREADVETARVKGSDAMATVVARALDLRRGWTSGDLVLNAGTTRFTVRGDHIREITDDARRRSGAHNDLRDHVRARLAEACYAAYRQQQELSGRAAVATMTSIVRLNGFQAALDRMWPSLTPEALVRSLYSVQDLLVRSSEGVLPPEDRARLYRGQATSMAEEPWTIEDLAVLDEAHVLLNGHVQTYGHIVVDEAQMLSPMQARAIARRCPSASITLLGDLAQATGAWIRDDWSELTRHFASEARTATLNVGYRVPRPVMQLAAEQLPLISPGLAAPSSVRNGLGEPEVVRSTSTQDLFDDIVDRARHHEKAGLQVGVIVPDIAYDDVVNAFADHGVTVGDGRDGDLAPSITAVPASLCHGLEFNAVVVVEPNAIVQESWQGRRSLYVALTRCTQALSVVHSEPLPAGMTHLEPEPEVLSDAIEVAEDDMPSAAPDTLDDLIAQLSPDDLALVEGIVRRLLTPGGDQR